MPYFRPWAFCLLHSFTSFIHSFHMLVLSFKMPNREGAGCDRASLPEGCYRGLPIGGRQYKPRLVRPWELQVSSQQGEAGRRRGRSKDIRESLCSSLRPGRIWLNSASPTLLQIDRLGGGLSMQRDAQSKPSLHGRIPNLPKRPSAPPSVPLQPDFSIPEETTAYSKKTCFKGPLQWGTRSKEGKQLAWTMGCRQY